MLLFQQHIIVDNKTREHKNRERQRERQRERERAIAKELASR
jgi:hypothetical protein